MPPTLPPVTIGRKPASCPHTYGVRLTWAPMRGGRRHIRETCAACGRFLRWAPQTPFARAMADVEAEDAAAATTK